MGRQEWRLGVVAHTGYLALGRLKQKDREFKANVNYTERDHRRKKKRGRKEFNGNRTVE